MEKFHFIGIKGTGMSALAQILKGAGYIVQGSDVTERFFTDQALIEAGIKILPFSPDNIEEGWTIICGNAFLDSHPEMEKAKALNLKIYRYHHFLGEWIKQTTSVAITGSHGKTSTTGLMAHVLGQFAKTSYLIGDGTGLGVADGQYFVLEADEYRQHFLAYQPDYAIFTNIDFDHPDFYHDIDEVFAANRQFFNQVKKRALLYGDDPYLRQLADDPKALYYGLESGVHGHYDILAKNIQADSSGFSFTVDVLGETYGDFKIHGVGEHQLLNSLAVIGFCALCQIPETVVREGLLTYGGVKRRFNITESADYVLIDDYAHHPREIAATIQAARQKYPDRIITAIFQPHTFSRTRALLTEFAQALNTADEVYLCDIFASARESDHHEVSIFDLLELVERPGGLLPLNEVSVLRPKKEHVLLFMGAGDVGKYQKAFVNSL